MISRGNYRVNILAGPYSWSATDQSAEGFGIADGLSISRSLPDDKPWPSQPNPATASFGILAESVADVAQLVRGVQVRIVYSSPRDLAVSTISARETFDGRVTDVALSPARVRVRVGGVPTDVDCVLASVTAVELMSEWSELTVGAEPWPSEIMSARMVRLFAAAGLAAPVIPPIGTGNPMPHYDPTVTARDVDAQAFGPLLERHLASWGGSFEWLIPPAPDYLRAMNSRMIVQPVLSLSGPEPAQLPTISGYQLVPQFDRIIAATADAAGHGLPGEFGNNPAAGGYGYVPRDAGVEPGGFAAESGRFNYVESRYIVRNGAWSQRKADRPNRVEVTYDTDQLVAVSSGESPRVTYRVETDLVGAAAAARVAEAYRPVANYQLWEMDTFTWELWREPTRGRYHRGLGSLLGVGPISARWNPLGREWYDGILAGYTLTIANARPELALNVRPLTRRVVGPDAAWLTFGNMPAGVTFNQLNPRDTFDDYNLIGAPA